MKLRVTSVVAGFGGNQYMLSPSYLTSEPFCDMPADGLYDVYTFEWGGGHIGSRQGRWQLTHQVAEYEQKAGPWLFEVVRTDQHQTDDLFLNGDFEFVAVGD